jgi:UDP-GlcNAc:undecaprenyl-phosphate GlcNAc-1-phosphate transferase
VSDFLTNPIINLHIDALGNTGGAPMGDTLSFLLPLITALVVSMAIIPVMVRLAPVLGMIDRPDPRKVHAVAIPRVGGVGIVIGALLPIILLQPMDQTLMAFLFGGFVLLGFGAWDDSHELGHYVKFIGQFIAVLAVVYYGDVYVRHLPLIGDAPLPETVGKLFTVIAMIGMINAINHSDGLDGLAGGESLMSLACIAWLSWLAGGTTTTIIALATIGGLFGFLRFNTYPARIFMGDGGSQFLGYTLGFLAVVLTQEVNQALSPALPLLLLGLPIADIIAVIVQRIYHKMNWFRATRNHIHHRLLDLGFNHHESVIIVYSVQALLVLCAATMLYESDSLIIGVYLAVVAVVFISLYVAERSKWQVRSKTDEAPLDDVIGAVMHRSWLLNIPYAVILYGISIFLVSGALISTSIPVDFTIVAAILFLLLLLRLLVGYRAFFLPLRLLVYMAIIFVVYLLNTYQPAYLSGADLVTYVFFGAIVVATGLSIRFISEGNFNITPTDYLVVLALVILVVLASKQIVDSRITAIALKSIILFYGCELILNRMKSRWNIFTFSALLALFVIGLRGLAGNLFLGF